MKHLLILSLIVLTAISSCTKDEDDNGDNNNTAKDGSITFYTNNDDCGDISLYLDGENIGPLTDVYTGTSEPACGDANTITIDVNVGSYEYYATDTCDHIWSGTIIINKGETPYDRVADIKFDEMIEEVLPPIMEKVRKAVKKD